MPTDLTTFVAAVLALVLSPGPNLAIVLGHATAGGRGGGLATTAGIILGFALYGLGTAFGLTQLVQHAPQVVTMLGYVGAGYLMWLGLRNLLRAGRPLVGTDRPDHRLGVALRDGLVTNLLNPKCLMFYLALVPPFLDPTRDVFQQSLILAGIHASVAGTWFVIVTMLAQQLARWFAQEQIEQRVQTITGAALILFGIRMLIW